MQKEKEATAETTTSTTTTRTILTAAIATANVFLQHVQRTEQCHNILKNNFAKDLKTATTPTTTTTTNIFNPTLLFTTHLLILYPLTTTLLLNLLFNLTATATATATAVTSITVMTQQCLAAGEAAATVAVTICKKITSVFFFSSS